MFTKRGATRSHQMENRGLMQKSWINALLVCVMIAMTTCGTKKGVATEVRDIAYDVDSGFGYTVYVEENERYIPYLVLTTNYNDMGDWS